VPTEQEIRKDRLRIDLEELESFRGNVIQWTSKSRAPLILSVTYNIRSIIGINRTQEPIYRSTHNVEINVPNGFPFDSPVAYMADGWEPVFHPNFYEGKGAKICTLPTGSKWRASESLGAFVIRIAKMIRFDSDVTNPGNAARSSAATWYNANLHRGLFPTDTVRLPLIDDDPEDDSFTIVRQWD
jgi:ubiquitin-protein ligase